MKTAKRFLAECREEKYGDFPYPTIMYLRWLEEKKPKKSLEDFEEFLLSCEYDWQVFNELYYSDAEELAADMISDNKERGEFLAYCRGE